MKRKILTIDGAGRFEVELQDVPSLNEYDVLVEVKASGISPGTELGGIKHLRANPSNSTNSRAFGYQNSGIVVEIGKQVKNLKEGMRVACMGSGARHASFAVVPQNLCIPIPENVSFQEAAFTNLAGTAVQAIRRAQTEFGENFFIAGLGIVGNMIGQLASLCGCHTVGIDFFENRRVISKKVGFELVLTPEDDSWIEECQNFSAPYGIDAVFLCFGGDATLFFQKIIKIMKVSQDGHFMGRIVIPGGCEIKTRFASTLGNLDIRSSARTGPGYHDDSYEQGNDYPKVFVPWTTRRNIEEFYKAVSKGSLNINSIISHSFSLDEGAKACNLLVDYPEKALGVVLQP